MMTFRPYADHGRSAAVLDYRRLGKQRVEALQIMQACLSYVTGEHHSAGWASHPVVKMWAGRANPYNPHQCGSIHLQDLLDYHQAISDEWVARGYLHQHNYRIIPIRAIIELNKITPYLWCADHPLPWPKELADQHKRILLRKDPQWYGQYWRIRGS